MTFASTCATRLLLTIFLLASSSRAALRILLSNVDSWASANIRATYDVLREHGHDVVISAPAVRQDHTRNLYLEPRPLGFNAEWHLLPFNASATGMEPNDRRIRYVNAPPPTAVRYGILGTWPGELADYRRNPDLVIVGPDEGEKRGRHRLFASSAYFAARLAIKDHNVPAIVIRTDSASYLHRSYHHSNGPQDPSYRYARATVDLVNAIDDAAGNRGRPAIADPPAQPPESSSEIAPANASISGSTREETRRRHLLPRGIGLTVNLADAVRATADEWDRTPWAVTRVSGGRWENIKCFTSCAQHMPPLETRVARSGRRMHTVSPFHVNGAMDHQPQVSDIAFVKTALEGRLPYLTAF